MHLIVILCFLFLYNTEYAESTMSTRKICPQYLRKYSTECKLSATYTFASKILKNKGIDIEELVYYKALRLIDIKDMHLDKKTMEYQPEKIYQPAPKTWEFWERGNRKRKEISARMKQNRIFDLS
ncbi:MAG: hypothetical protein HQK53_16205, partial [Oligoflexia bacterium]|nr:hypothetical protein [Oligoflexia bacterium]